MKQKLSRNIAEMLGKTLFFWRLKKTWKWINCDYDFYWEIYFILNLEQRTFNKIHKYKRTHIATTPLLHSVSPTAYTVYWPKQPQLNIKQGREKKLNAFQCLFACEDCSLRRVAKKHISIETHFCCEILNKMPRRSDSESQPSQNEICTKLF